MWPPSRKARGARAGQSLIEACIVIIFICLILFSALQISQLYAAQEVLAYTAGRAARAEAVGFNRFMVYKVYRVGAIPNAGHMLTPGPVGPSSSSAGLVWTVGNGIRLWNDAMAATPVSPLTAIERSSIPLYLGGEDWAFLPAILDYDAWDTLNYSSTRTPAQITATVSQNYPLTNFPFRSLYYAGDMVPIAGICEIEHHAWHYLDDMGW